MPYVSGLPRNRWLWRRRTTIEMASSLFLVILPVAGSIGSAIAFLGGISVPISGRSADGSTQHRHSPEHGHAKLGASLKPLLCHTGYNRGRVGARSVFCRASVKDDLRDLLEQSVADERYENKGKEGSLTIPWLKRPVATKQQDSVEALKGKAMHHVVMMRHGESLFNKHNVFTGWCDIPLTDAGRREATHAGHIMASHGLKFDVVFCSVLQRSSVSAHLAMEACGQSWVEVRSCWELNERHYGALQGLSKAAMAAERGEEHVKAWRSSYHTRPPAMGDRHPHWDLIASDRRYEDVPLVPTTESIADTAERVMALWQRDVAPLVAAGKRVLIVAHRNSLRALIRNLEGLTDDQVAAMTIPTGKPFLYPLDENLRPVATPIACPLEKPLLRPAHPDDGSDDHADIATFSVDAAATAAAAAAAAAAAPLPSFMPLDPAEPTSESPPPLPSKQTAVQVSPQSEASGVQASVAKTVSDIRSQLDEVAQHAEEDDQSRWQSDASLLLPEQSGCGFQGIFLQDNDTCTDRYVQRKVHACMAKWDEDPAHPPDECLFQPSEECIVDI